MSFAVNGIGLLGEWLDSTQAMPAAAVCVWGKPQRDRTSMGGVLEPPLPDTFRAIHGEVAGLSVRF